MSTLSSPRVRPLLSGGFGLALMLIAGGLASVSSAQPAVPNAATVAPAPVIDKPLAPAVNDTPSEQPSPGHAWVPGHWRWFEGAYVWESGRWEMPPAANLAWHAPEWVKQGNGYVLREGFWDDAPPPAPRVVAPATTPAPVVQEVVATMPPPPPQREVIYERPSPVHVWVGGYWGWQLGKHVWVSGRWSTPPRPNALWVGPRWDYRGGRYVFVDGYWRDAVVAVPSAPPQVIVAPPPPAGQPVTVVAAPPPPRVEVVYARPGPDFVWIGGYWAWRGGRHVWIAGHYERPPRGHRHWEEPRWERRGGSYIFIEGRWR